jgi:hypothetical protein
MRYRIIALMTKEYIMRHPSLYYAPQKGDLYIYVREETKFSSLNKAYDYKMRVYNDGVGYYWTIEEQ